MVDFISATILLHMSMLVVELQGNLAVVTFYGI